MYSLYLLNRGAVFTFPPEDTEADFAVLPASDLLPQWKISRVLITSVTLHPFFSFPSNAVSNPCGWQYVHSGNMTFGLSFFFRAALRKTCCRKCIIGTIFSVSKYCSCHSLLQALTVHAGQYPLPKYLYLAWCFEISQSLNFLSLVVWGQMGQKETPF